MGGYVCVCVLRPICLLRIELLKIPVKERFNKEILKEVRSEGHEVEMMMVFSFLPRPFVDLHLYFNF